MILAFIVAVAENNAIGIRNTLPWYLPEDLKFFKRTTLGKPVIMGRKTYESLGKPLPGRLNIVLTHQRGMEVPDGVLLYEDVNDAIRYLEDMSCDECFIIGGGKVFESTLPLVDRLYITRVHTSIANADTFFPEIDHSHWKLVWEEYHHADEQHQYAFTFQQFDRLEL